MKTTLTMISRRHFRFQRGCLASLIAALLSLVTAADGIILLRTGDPTANTTEPGGELTGSGWQYQGSFGNFLGTPIAPHFFITAGHVGGVEKFVYHGTAYTVTRSFDDPGSDLRIYEVAETFPLFAPLYIGSGEVGERFVVIGRGTQRGPERVVNGQVRGFDWGRSDSVQRWGENQVASIKPSGQGDLLYALFDQAGLPHEGHLSSGDSSGGLFVQEAGLWKLAGICYDVDRFASGPDGGGPYNAAMYDMRGSYRPNGSLVTGDAPVPSGFYATRVSTRLAWINSIIKPRLANISARATVGSDDRVGIGGFIIGGERGESKRVIVRALGPSMQVNGVALPGRIADPVLELHDVTGATISTNNNWASAQAAEIQASGLAPLHAMEAALIATLPAGGYTAVLRSADGSSGVGLIEVYDLDDRAPARLLNLSARAHVGTENNVLIGGFIVRSVSTRTLLRALGPNLAARGVSGVLLDPALTLHDANGAIISANDNWMDAPNSSEIIGTGLAPANARESAILTTADFNTYTAIVRGVGETSGIGLLEIYLVN